METLLKEEQEDKKLKTSINDQVKVINREFLTKRIELPDLIKRIQKKQRNITNRLSFVSSIPGTPFSNMNSNSFSSLEIW